MIDFGVKDIIDILLVAVLLYNTYRLMRESRSLNVFVGIMIFILVWVFVSQVLEMKLLGAILDKLVSVGVIVIVVIFQEDIRKVLYNLGAHRRIRTLVRLFSPKRVEEKDMPLNDIVATGEVIDAAVNQRLIENIFFKNSPLHDGAMVISNHRIKAAGCILPVSHDLDIPKYLGLRHRAALGMSQESDALCVIVSEETGGISIARNGHLKLRLSAEELESTLTDLMKA